MSTLKIHGRRVNTAKCPVIEASKIVGDFWNLWILRVLLDGSKRFSEIHTEIPTINKATLNNKLKVLIAEGFVNKTFDPNLKSQYALTTLGGKLRGVFLELEKFGKENL